MQSCANTSAATKEAETSAATKEAEYQKEISDLQAQLKTAQQTIDQAKVTIPK